MCREFWSELATSTEGPLYRGKERGRESERQPNQPQAEKGSSGGAEQGSHKACRDKGMASVIRTERQGLGLSRYRTEAGWLQ